jgi:hypothetical protein
MLMPSPKPGFMDQFRQTCSTLRGCEMLTLSLAYTTQICSPAIDSALYLLAIESMGLLTESGLYYYLQSAASST